MKQILHSRVLFLKEYSLVVRDKMETNGNRKSGELYRSREEWAE